MMTTRIIRETNTITKKVKYEIEYFKQSIWGSKWKALTYTRHGGIVARNHIFKTQEEAQDYIDSFAPTTRVVCK